MKQKKIKKLTRKVLDNLTGQQLLSIKRAVENDTLILKRTDHCLFALAFGDSENLAACNFKNNLGLVSHAHDPTICELEVAWWRNDVFTKKIIRKYFKKFKIRD